jgi:starch synthase
MYSQVYGTVPIVRETGGLADTVKRFDAKTEEGTGFMFKKYDAKDMISEISRAIKIFGDKKLWQKIQKAGMKEDFSWDRSARSYIELYKKILSED